MFEFRPSIVAINPAPTNLAANKIGFMGRLGVRGFAHRATTSNFGQQASFCPMNRALTCSFRTRDRRPSPFNIIAPHQRNSDKFVG